MNQKISLVLSGIVGGLVVLAGIFITKPFQTVLVEHSEISAKQVADINFSNPKGPENFVFAASKSTPAVVHIYAEESRELALKNREQRQQQQRRRNPGGFFNFDDFFGGNPFMEDFFSRDFFGSDFYGPKKGSGSGVIISKDGYIVTNNHVVGFADNIIITTQDKMEYTATKIGTDPSTDLALLKIEGGNFPFLEFADSESLKVGEWVLAVGNPFDYLTSTVTAGIVSAKGRELNIIKGEKTIEEFIQTDAAINPGNSGGALVNTEGKLVGINTAIATPTRVYAGYSFAIPSNLAKKIINQIKEKGGDIERVSSLGITGFEVDKTVKKELDLKVDYGFYIDEVDNKSSAKMAGLLPGDVITKINNKKVSSDMEILEAMKFAKAGDILNLNVNRNGKEIEIPVKLRKSF
jgi:serine protease Do